MLALGSGPAEAARHVHRHPHFTATGFAAVPVSESIVIDADTGKVLSQQNADAVTYPASLTKLMTLYLTFQDLQAGTLKLGQLLPVSAEAASRSPTKLGLPPGDMVPVQDLILGVVTRSANDAASVLAEGQAASEEAFAQRMTQQARQLGLVNTVFRNASGLPDSEQHTTARDIALLGLAIYRDFPRDYAYFATRRFDFRGRIITNHNHLLDWYPGADGIKTGYIRASGFNLAASAVRDGHRLVGVIMGGPSAGTRDREMAALLDQGFAQLGVAPPMVAHYQPAPHPVLAAVAPIPEPIHGKSSSGGKPGTFGKAAARLAAHLAPVGRAEAAEMPRPAAERWSIQLGAFHAETAAQKTGRVATGLPVARGKPVQIVGWGKTANAQLYRARLLNLTPLEAQTACAALHRKGLECAIVAPSPLRFADR